MTLTDETLALRLALDALAEEHDEVAFRAYALPRRPRPAGVYFALRGLAGNLLRLTGLYRPPRPEEFWRAELKHGNAAVDAGVLLIWAEGMAREELHRACAGFRKVLASVPDCVPVLVTDVADFAWYSRLGWLVEYLPDLANAESSGDGESYRLRKKRYLAWRYRNALAVPASAGLAPGAECKALLDDQN